MCMIPFYVTPHYEQPYSSCHIIRNYYKIYSYNILTVSWFLDFFRNGVSPASASIDAHSRFIDKFQTFTSIKQRKSENQLAIA
jgi:hypothetical protein